MNRTFSRMMAVLLAILPFTASAQNNIMSAFNAIIKCKDAKITQSHSMEKDPETGKKVGQQDIYTFTLPKDKMPLVQNVLNSFDKDSSKAYNLSSGKWERNSSKINLAVGDGSGAGVYINEPKRDYIYACFLAPKSEDKEGIYRYAYAFNYEEERTSIVGKIVITYATTLKYRQQEAKGKSSSYSYSYSNSNNAGGTVYVIPPSNGATNQWFDTFMSYVQSMSGANTQTRIALATKIYGLVRDINQYSKVSDSDKNAAREILKGMLTDPKYNETILTNLLNQSLTNLK